MADGRSHAGDGRRFSHLDPRHRWRSSEAGLTCAGAHPGHCGETVMQVPQVYRILPELWLIITGVLIMLIEPLMPPGMTRKPMGGLALIGVLGPLVASVGQSGVPSGTRCF